jgi:hypothetical protein
MKYTRRRYVFAGNRHDYIEFLMMFDIANKDVVFVRKPEHVSNAHRHDLLFLIGDTRKVSCYESIMGVAQGREMQIIKIEELR